MNRHTQKSQRLGFVLIVVLGMVMAIMVLVLNLTRRSRVSLQISDVSYRAIQAWAAAQSGLQTGLHAIRFIGDVTVDDRTQTWFHHEQNLPVPHGDCRLSLMDESGKLNINQLKHADGRLNRQAIDQLLRLIDTLNRQTPEAPSIRYGLVPALIDWTDKDKKVTVLPFIHKDNRGDESDAHGPTGCANRPLTDLSELNLIKGFTPEIVTRLRPFLTLYGDARINLNSASTEVLTALSEHIDLTVARLIVKYRERSPFENHRDLQSIPGLPPAALNDLQRSGSIGQSGPYYRIQAQGRVENQAIDIEALVKKNPEAQTVDILQYRESPARIVSTRLKE